ncbi:MerR family transcriptional regulator, partial [Actinomadura adrarensis]
WDAAGLVVPQRRASAREARKYSPDDVRDARIVHQLRLAGYRIPQLQALIPELRQAGRWDELMSTLATRHESIEARSKALVHATAEISVLIG